MGMADHTDSEGVAATCHLLCANTTQACPSSLSLDVSPLAAQILQNEGKRHQKRKARQGVEKPGGQTYLSLRTPFVKVCQFLSSDLRPMVTDPTAHPTTVHHAIAIRDACYASMLQGWPEVQRGGPASTCARGVSGCGNVG